MSKNFTHLEVHHTRVGLLNKSICFLFNDDIGSFSFKAADFKYPVMLRIHFLVSFIGSHAYFSHSIKRYQGQLREAEVHYEEAARLRQEMSEKASLAERRSNALQGEMEEARALLDSAERGKRQTEAELTEARMAVNEMNNVNSRAGADKRRLEGAVHTLQAEIDDMLHQAKGSEEKAKKAMVDAARLADELRAEQDHVSVQSKAKRSLETTMADMENRLADANESAMKGGKADMAKLESRIRELETELGSVQARTSDNMKGHQKAERKIKELAFQNDEDKKNQVAMSDLAGKLQSKIKTYKKQIEEAEEIAALNLAKFRKAQQELEETEVFYQNNLNLLLKLCYGICHYFHH